jgi:transcriptional regulator with XRE-family HTH domain
VDTEEFYKELGRRVAAIRRRDGLSQVDVAAASGLKRATIASFETGRQRMHVHQLYAVAKGLRLSDLEELIPIQVPSDAHDGAAFGSDLGVSDVQAAQIDTILRTAVAVAREKTRK